MNFTKTLNAFIKSLDKKVLLIIIIVLSISLALVLGINKEGFEDARSALPPGIPKEEIPEGDEDLYIKKSEIVPPVCPKCPNLIQKDIDTSKCPPCPACKRCPAPAEVECKKVMKYDSNASKIEGNKSGNINISTNIKQGSNDAYEVGSTSEMVTRIPVSEQIKLREGSLEDTIEIGGLLGESHNGGTMPVLANFSNF